MRFLITAEIAYKASAASTHVGIDEYAKRPHRPYPFRGGRKRIAGKWAKK